MAFLFPIAQSLVMRIANDRRVKELVIALLEKYVKSTDNDVDDLIVATVKSGLLKD